jgi:membrane associated rhomboid family serine protease
MAQSLSWQHRFSFGGRLPWAVGLVLTVTVALSLVVALSDRHAGGIFDVVSLVPAQVLHGQVWRLATWAFVEPSPLSLIFACLMLYWFGRDLAQEMGSGRWLLLFGVVGLVSAAATCLVALFDTPVLDQTYLGGWALSCAMIVAWGLWFPHRVVRIYFVLPITGYWLAWLTVALTVIFAVYAGWQSYLPEIFAEASILAWLYRRVFASRLKGVQRDLDDRRRRAERAARVRKGAAHLRVVESLDEDDAPLPPDLEAKVQDLLKPKK